MYNHAQVCFFESKEYDHLALRYNEELDLL